MPAVVGSTIYDRAALLDAGALIALADPSDDHAEEAAACLTAVVAARLPVYVTTHTLAEAHRRLLFRIGSDRARMALDLIYDGSVNVVRCLPEDEAEARRILARYASVQLSLGDALAMATMVRMGIRTVVSFDDDFLIAGFVRIPPFYVWW